jgi:insulin-like growth factor-binding protein complex acid labile subunit
MKFLSCLVMIYIAHVNSAELPCKIITGEACWCDADLAAVYKIACYKLSNATAFPNLTHLASFSKKSYVLSFNHRMYREVPDFDFENLNLNILDLSDNQIEHFSENAFKGMVDLKYLKVNNNKLTTLLLNNLANLNILYVSQNQVNMIYNTTFAGLRILTLLDLSDNKIGEIEQGSFFDLYRLTKLLLQRNKQKVIKPNLLARQTYLEELYLSENLIEVIYDTSFNGLIALKSMTIDKNQIKKIEKNSFSYLKFFSFQIRLDFQKLQSLEPFAFNNLYCITTNLFLNNNFLTTILNYSFVGLDSINNLYLSENKISSININGFHGLFGLKRLYLTSNELSIVEEKIFQNTKQLAELYLGDNQLIKIERSTFSGIENSLLFLNLTNNRLLFIKDFYFKSIKNLADLYLKSNQLSTIESNSFMNNAKLKLLDLSNNCITKVNHKWFASLIILDSLSLDLNVIKKLELNTFPSTLSKLTKLNLSVNELTELEPPRLFASLSNLKELYLANNYIRKMSTLAFFNLNKLGVLDLRSNLLETLSDSLTSLKILRYLYLSNNLFKSIFFNPNLENLYCIELNNNENLKEMTNFTGLVTKLYLRNANTELITNMDFSTYSRLNYLDLSNNHLTYDILKAIETNLNIQSLILRSTNITYSNQFVSLNSKLNLVDLSDNYFETYESALFLNKNSYLYTLKLDNINLILWFGKVFKFRKVVTSKRFELELKQDSDCKRKLF